MNDFFKLVQPIIALVIGCLRGPRENSFSIPDEILNQLRKLLLLAAQLVGSLVLFLLGMSYFIERLLDQLDSGTFHFSNALIFLTIFMSLSLISMFYATKKSVWTAVFNKPFEKESSAKKMQTHAQLETAISLFILDIVKERELNREKTTPSTEQ